LTVDLRKPRRVTDRPDVVGAVESPIAEGHLHEVPLHVVTPAGEPRPGQLPGPRDLPRVDVQAGHMSARRSCDIAGRPADPTTDVEDHRPSRDTRAFSDEALVPTHRRRVALPGRRCREVKRLAPPPLVA